MGHWLWLAAPCTLLLAPSPPFFAAALTCASLLATLVCSSPGSYSAAGAAECTPCSAGTYAPSAGQANSCQTCPTGSLALAVDGDAAIVGKDLSAITGATFCDPW